MDGEAIQAVVSSIDADGVFKGQNIPDGLELDDLRRIDRPAESPQSPDTAVIVELAGGGRLRGQRVMIENEECRVAWGLGQPVGLSIDSLRAVRFLPQVPSETFDRALATPSAEYDRIFVTVDGNLQPLTGLIEQLTDKEVVFEWKGEQHRVARDRLYGIVVAQLGDTPLGRAKCTVHLRDGSQLPGSVDSLLDGKLTLQLTPTTQVGLPWDAVTRIDVRSSRMVFLSELNPAEAVQKTLVTLPSEWRRDRSVGGRPLTLNYSLGEKQGTKPIVFDKGLGTHSMCRLTFDTGGNFDVLAAAIGIDAETNGKGDCVFTVLGDGEQLYSQRVKGTDSLRELKLDISGRRQVTLVVDPGEDLDLADHANWCDARLIRNEE